ncbi:MAG: hypothetical protein HQL43_00540 [Alphaproteobacteria bacterium]|nr:hypothetical protein [Alphaproteobacteria bacterium]
MTNNRFGTLARFADVVLAIAALVAILLCAALLFLGVYVEHYGPRAIAMAALPLACAAGLFLLRKASAEIRIGISLSLFVFALFLYAFEALISSPPISAIEQRKQTAASMAQRGFDFRTPAQYIHALRKQGVNAYPALFPRKLLEATEDGSGSHSPILINGQEVIPLGGVPNVTTVQCNESGAYAIYKSDEFGFRNPTGLWTKDRLDLALLGDSFLQGDCVPSGDDVASRLRMTWPKTVTLGMRNNGPLLQLAGLREFLSLKRPKTVVWFFYEGNDLSDLNSERRSRILLRYLEEPTFSQAIAPRSQELSASLRQYLDQLLDHEDKSVVGGPQSGSAIIIDWLLLRSTRSLLGLSLSGDTPLGIQLLTQRLPLLRSLLHAPTNPSIVQPDDFVLLERILATAKHTIDAWNGRFVLVYIPDPLRLCGRIKAWQQDCPRHPDLSALNSRYSEMRRIAARISAPLLDLAAEMEKEAHPEVYYYYYGSHHSRNGYAWMSDKLKAYLEVRQ